MVAADDFGVRGGVASPAPGSRPERAEPPRGLVDDPVDAEPAGQVTRGGIARSSVTSAAAPLECDPRSDCYRAVHASDVP
jgi:hypothetical protein